MLGDELVVVEMRIGILNTVQLFSLPQRKSLVPIQTPYAFHQPLPHQDLVDTSDTASKAVCSIKDHSVGVGDLCR